MNNTNDCRWQSYLNSIEPPTHALKGRCSITREETVQFSLFQDESREKARKVDKAKDALNARFGSATIVRGSSIQSKLDVGKKYKAQMELHQKKEEK